MDIILYSNGCPNCNVLKKKLVEKNIAYKEINNVETMKAKGFTTVPMLEVDGISMNYKESFNFVETI